jgi:translation elongation factor EF-1alpha
MIRGEDKAYEMNSEQHAFPVVIAGHMDHGKSTLIGSILHDTGSLQDACGQNVLQNLADAGPADTFAFVLDAFEEERLKGIRRGSENRPADMPGFSIW